MKTITIKNLTIQVDISKAHGNMVADALTVIDLINKTLQEANLECQPQIMANGLDSSDIEAVLTSEEDFRMNFNIIENPTAQLILTSAVEIYGFSLKNGSDFFFEDETLEEIQAILNLNEFIFGTKKY